MANGYVVPEGLATDGFWLGLNTGMFVGSLVAWGFYSMLGGVVPVIFTAVLALYTAWFVRRWNKP